MGARLCGQTPKSLDFYKNQLVTSVETGNVSRIKKMSRRLAKSSVLPFSLDDPILVIQEVELNALAYAFRLGHANIVKFLIDEQPRRVEQLYLTFGKIGKSPMDFVCEYGFLDLLRYYLPMHVARDQLTFNTAPGFSQEEPSLFDSLDVKAAYSYSTQKPIHRACEKGQMAVITYIYEYFRKSKAPEDLDVHTIDESTGENCALISVRTGNLALMKYLHEVCGADFHKLNLRGESAMQLAASASKRRPEAELFDCFVYLVEEVKVNVLLQYEETLLLCERKDLVQYLEARLSRLGVRKTKLQLELECQLIRGRAEPERHSISLRSQPNLLEIPPDSRISSINRQSATPRDSSIAL